MERNEFINKLRESAKNLADVMGCKNFETQKGDCGIWDKISPNATMTDYLEKNYGDCSTEWRFSNESNDTEILTRFRFSHPCIWVKRVVSTPVEHGLLKRIDFIELEFTNTAYFVNDSGGEEQIETDFRCTQIMLWGNWFELKHNLLNCLDKDIRDIVKL